MNAVLAETSQFLGDDWDTRPELFDAPIMLKSGEASVLELWERFDQSPYGLHMDSQPLRFAEHYGYDRTAMIADLGADVVPRYHQYETGLYVARLLSEERRQHSLLGLNDEQAALLAFTATIHDMGETTHPEIEAEVGGVVGDIPYDEKTEENRRIESAVRAALYRRLYADLPECTLQRVESIVSHQDKTLLHEVFEAAHTLQSYMTAVRAHITFEKGLAQMLEFANTDSPRVISEGLESLGRLAIGVTGHMRPKVESYAGVFSFARTVAQLGKQAMQASGDAADGSYFRYRSALKQAY